MVFDCHTHIQFPVYNKDREEVIKRARDSAVKMICVGTQASTSESALELAEDYSEDIWATAGFHPNHLSDNWYHDKKEQEIAEPEKFNIDKLRQLAKHPKVVAIGECGLDYYRLENKEVFRQAQDKQKEVFSKQIKLAEELSKPLMIHCRPRKGTDDAYEDLLSLIHNFEYSKISHFYVGSLAITKKLLDEGFHFTFGGVITFARDYDEVIKYIPLERILLETDAPYVAPASYRGKRNEPAYILETAKKLAEIKGVNYEKVSEIIRNNTLRIFQISV